MGTFKCFFFKLFSRFHFLPNQDNKTIQVFPWIIATNLERFHQSKQTTIMFSTEERLFSQRELTEKKEWKAIELGMRVHKRRRNGRKKSSRKSSLDIIRSYSNRFYHWFSPPRWLIFVPKNHRTLTGGDKNHNWKSFLRDLCATNIDF